MDGKDITTVSERTEWKKYEKRAGRIFWISQGEMAPWCGCLLKFI
jgi:hypothetical protein